MGCCWRNFQGGLFVERPRCWDNIHGWLITTVLQHLSIICCRAILDALINQTGGAARYFLSVRSAGCRRSQTEVSGWQRLFSTSSQWRHGFFSWCLLFSPVHSHKLRKVKRMSCRSRHWWVLQYSSRKCYNATPWNKITVSELFMLYRWGQKLVQYSPQWETRCKSTTQ